jgi:hypothetical protein
LSIVNLLRWAYAPNNHLHLAGFIQIAAPWTDLRFVVSQPLPEGIPGAIVIGSKLLHAVGAYWKWFIIVFHSNEVL